MPEMIGRQPDAVIACVGGGSNAMGIFYPYIDHERTRLIGVEAAGEGLAQRPARGVAQRRHARRAARQPHLPAAGRRRPDHRDALDLGRPRLSRRRPRARLAEGHRPRRVRRHHRRRGAGRVPRLCRTEGIIPALESSHAVAYAMKLAPTLRPDQHLLVNLSGRGDKDIAHRRRARRERRRAASVGSRMSRIAATFAALRERGRKALIPYVTAGDPHADATPQIMQALADGRRRRHRARRAVLRPDGRRPGDPEGERARAGARHRPGAGARRWCATFRARDDDDAGRADGLREPDRALRRRALRRRRAARPASTACSSSTIRPRSATSSPRCCKARGIDPIFLLAPTSTDARIASVGRRSPAATSTTCR